MIKPYLIIPIAFSILVLYFLSFFAMRAGLLSKSLHLKLWNISLIITFLFTAILGLILAFQVNYKIEIPFIKEILTIHVDFGIAMSFIAVFHLIWHIRYYIELLKPGKKILFPNNDKSISSMAYLNIEKNKLFTLLVVLGFSTSIVQVIMLREFISVFYSNELIFGIILSLWLTLTGIGAYTGNRQNLRILNRKKLFIICILPGSSTNRYGRNAKPVEKFNISTRSIN